MFIVEVMVEAIKGIMIVGINDLLSTIEKFVTMIKIDEQNTNDVLMPVINVSMNEQTNQEQIAHLKAYNLHITIPIRNNKDGFFFLD